MDGSDLIAEARRLGRRALDEAAGKRLLARFGVRVPRSVVVREPREAERAAAALEPPFAVKLVSPDILHKSEARALRLGVSSRAELAAACEAIRADALAYLPGARIEGYLVEEMAPPGAELVVGGVRDEQFGPLVMVGLGGVFVELLADVAFRICPITRTDAFEMLEELRGARLFEGVRGRKPVPREAVVDVLLKVGGEGGLLARHAADLAEADINPLIVSEAGAFAVDARFVLAAAPAGKEGCGAGHARAEGVLSPQAVLERFRPLFEPRTVAVVGASSRGEALPNVFIRRVQELGFAGEIYPIHPSAPEIGGLRAYRSLADTPRPVDYAYVAVSATQVPALLREARGRVRFAQVISSGFGEVEEGRALQQQLAAAAREAGMRLLGPNCLGLYSPRGRLSFAEVGTAEPGPVGVVSQSGGLGTDIVRRGLARGLRFSGLVTVGNCADVQPAELLEYFLADPHTRIVGLYLEDARDGRRLFERLREARAAKPVVLLKGGRTRLGRLAAASHTGALAGEDRAWVAAARQTGCVLVETLEAFLDALLAFQFLEPRPERPTRRVVLFGNGGGASVLATDAFARLGLEVEPFERATVERLAALGLPPGTSLANPVDCPVGTLRQEEGRVAERLLELVHEHAAPDALVMHLNLSAFVGRTSEAVLDNLVQAALRVRSRSARSHFALVLRSDGDPALEQRRRAFRARAIALGVPVYDELLEAGRGLAALACHERFVNSRLASG
jgi:acyl-CoA synthetase (NDP forming)